MNNVGQVSDQPIQNRVHRCLRAQMVIVVEHQDELLLDPFEYFV